MATEPLTGSRIPDLSFAPNVPADISNAVRDLADNTIPQFTSTGGRDAAYSAWVAAGNAMRNGLWCTVNTTLYEYSTVASGWVEMGDSGAWLTFSPGWSSSGSSNPSIGNGTLAGRYRKIGRLCFFSIQLTFGTTTNGGIGSWTFSGLPFTAANYEQDVMAKCTTVAGFVRNWAGFAWIPANTNTVLPFFGNNATPQFYEQVRNTDNTGAAGTSVPFVSGTSSFGTPGTGGSNLIVTGAYETTS